jgi:hypothetical protein
MKKSLSILILLISLCACSIEPAHTDSIQTVPTKSEIINKEFYVTNELASSYAKASCPFSLKFSEIDIEPYVEESDTLMYIINYGEGNGWTIIGADIRAELPIAKGDDGYFNLKTINPEVMEWFNGEKEFVKYLRRLGKEATNPNSCSIWDRLIALKCKLPATKVIIPPPSIEYELREYIITVDTTIASVNHLTNTLWGQHSPWSQCNPFCNDFNVRCSLGPVSVTGAQLLYYLHYNLGRPNAFYTFGLLNGNLNDYTPIWGNSSLTAFDQMALDSSQTGTSYSAVLLSYVADGVDTDFGFPTSSAYPDSLINVFNDFGISAGIYDYDQATVINTLNDSMPLGVICWVNGSPSNRNEWIIDGYKTTCKCCLHCFIYHEVGTPLIDYDTNEDIIANASYIVSDSFTNIASYVFMNWGLDYRDNSSYAIQGSWILGTDIFVPTNRKIFTNFTLLNQ